MNAVRTALLKFQENPLKCAAPMAGMICSALLFYDYVHPFGSHDLNV